MASIKGVFQSHSQVVRDSDLVYIVGTESFKATRVRDKRLYGTGLAVLCWSLWLISHNVLLNAQNVGSAGKQTWPGVHCPNGPQFNMAVRITSEHTYTQDVIGCCIQRLFDTQANHHTPFGAPRRVRMWIGIGIGCAMAAERWVWANEISIFFLCRDQCLTHVLTRGIRTHTNFTSEWST